MICHCRKQFVSSLDWSSSVQSRRWENNLCCQVGEKIWCNNHGTKMTEPLLMWGCWWGIVQGEKTVFFFFTWTNEAFPKIFQAELEAYVHPVWTDSNLKNQVQPLLVRTETFNFISWFCRSELTVIKCLLTTGNFVNTIYLFWLQVSERPSGNLETYAVMFTVLPCNRTCMAFIIRPTLTLLTLTSTDKLYKIHVILQGVWFGLQAAASLHYVMRISAWKRGKKSQLASLFNSSGRIISKREFTTEFLFFLLFLSLEMMDWAVRRCLKL